MTNGVGKHSEFVVLQVDGAQLSALTNFLRQCLQLVKRQVQSDEPCQLSDRGRKMGDVVLTNAQVGKVRQSSNVFSDLPDPVEAQVEGRQACQLVDSGGYLRQPIVTTVKHSQPFQVGQAVGQRRQHVLL